MDDVGVRRRDVVRYIGSKTPDLGDQQKVRGIRLVGSAEIPFKSREASSFAETMRGIYRKSFLSRSKKVAESECVGNDGGINGNNLGTDPASDSGPEVSTSGDGTNSSTSSAGNAAVDAVAADATLPEGENANGNSGAASLASSAAQKSASRIPPPLPLYKSKRRMQSAQGEKLGEYVYTEPKTGINMQMITPPPQHIHEIPAGEPFAIVNERLTAEMLMEDAKRLANPETVINRVVFDSVEKVPARKAGEGTTNVIDSDRGDRDENDSGTDERRELFYRLVIWV